MAKTLVHEMAHFWYNIGGSQRAEAICFAMEKMHVEDRDFLTKSEWEDLAQKVKKAYHTYPWRSENDGCEKHRFDFIR